MLHWPHKLATIAKSGTGLTILALPNGVELSILSGKAAKLLKKRKVVYRKVGLGDHWSDADSERDSWPMLPALITLDKKGSLRRDDRAGAGRAGPPLVARQRAELRVINGIGEWQRILVYIKAVEGMQPFLDLVDDSHQLA